MNDIRLYKCYSENQKDWLYNKGIRYILKARDYNNSNKMWLYHENDLLMISYKNGMTIILIIRNEA